LARAERENTENSGKVSITVIGSGGCWPTRERLGPGLVVDAAGPRLLLDCGPDCLHGLSRAGIPHQSITVVLVSHFHPDHTLGLAHLLFAERYQLAPRTGKLLLAGPTGLSGLIEGFRRLYPRWLEPRGFELEILELGMGKREFPGWTLEVGRARHRPESLAYRVEAVGRSLLYTGDTAYAENLADLGRGVDLFVAEASFPEEAAVAGHLTPVQAGRLAREAGAGRLLLTHLSPLCREKIVREQARAEFSGEVIVADDGIKLTV